MLSQRNIIILGIGIWLSLFLLTSPSVKAADIAPVITHVEEILKANPLKADEKIQMIKIAEDDAISLFVVRQTEGFVVRRHYHKAHAETLYVIQGSAQMLVDDKWVEVKPGSIHFNPAGKVHSVKNTGKEPLVSISIFTPALREPDRHFVE